MGDRAWHVGICGTFDVANYGDVLFPLIADAELKERLGNVTLHRFSYNSRTPPEWPYEVTSVTALPQVIDRLDGLLLGGGHIVRFDKQIAPGYAPPSPKIHHPTGYWLTPALLALQHDVPLMWNAPGTDCHEVPQWARPLMDLVLTESRYVSVRDELSRAALARLTSAPVSVVPDTAFGISRFIDRQDAPSAEFERLREFGGLDGPYVVIQAARGVDGFVRFVANHPQAFQNLRFLALPVGPALGDESEIVARDLPGAVRLSEWPGPLLIAELIARSEGIVGHSYHLFITALAAGVPVFTQQDLSTGKFSALKRFDIFTLPPEGAFDADWVLARLGRRTPSALARATNEPLGRHWDRIAAALRAARVPTAPALNRFWQSLPTLLEDAAARADEAIAALEARRVETEAERVHAEAARMQAEAGRSHNAEIQAQLDEALGRLALARDEAAQRQARLDESDRLLAAVRGHAAARDRQVQEITASTSWRLTAPVRFLRGHLRRNGRPHILRLDRIRRHRLEREPYQWAAVEDLFDGRDAARLADTYPYDHFKLVAGYGGEKDYEYEARSLIGMGASVVTHDPDLSEAWRALARDLLSPDYRAAMTALTGCDLMEVPMEANVFHYGPGNCLGPHRDLPEKIVTHVLYFNRSWNRADGGCLSILRSADPADQAAEIAPIVGHSAVIVRSDRSWHAVSRVVNGTTLSRRSVTVTFYRPGAISTMWPSGDTTPLHRYQMDHGVRESTV